MQLLIPVAAGLEAVVKRQLFSLGYPQAPAKNGRLYIEQDCSWQDVARLNVFLRSGERVLLCLGEAKTETFDELFDFVYSLPWEEWLSADSKILMDGKSYKSKLGAVKAIGSIAKKAVVKRLIAKACPHKKALKEDGARTVVGVSLFEDIATVTLDTSGEGLHKRGYRTLSYTAPLKETTAAAMLDLSVYHREKPFADLFCGSGTLPIEAALKALKIAPGSNRNFDFTAWKCAEKGVLELAREEAADVRDFSVKPNIYACDINPKSISMAKYHAKAAGVEQFIRFETKDMRAFSAKEKYGVIVSNPPYGERLGEEKEVQKLYKDLGMVYRSLPDWSLYALTSYPDFERYFGKRAEKKRKIYNADLQCNYYTYTGAKPPKNKETNEVMQHETNNESEL
ncbi:MAG: class I SAM-dependent RNA methyltransferase [Clostridia bacterium]|nr:class I SAM-dependent RNA methyltransferase [Clostridia bacterium]